MKKTKRASSRSEAEKLDEIIRLLQLTAALDMWSMGVKQQQIAKNLGIATATVNSLLKGIEKP